MDFLQFRERLQMLLWKMQLVLQPRDVKKPMNDSFQALLQLVLVKQLLGRILTMQLTQQHLVRQLMDQTEFLTAA